jgi:hypothetical protein
VLRFDRMRSAAWIAYAVVAFAPSSVHAAEYFDLRVVDGGGAGVPCVDLVTTNSIVHRTDANGRVAFYEDGLMGTSVWFSVVGPHVQMTPDAFGYQGHALVPTEGGSAQIQVSVVGASPCTPDDRETQRLARGVPTPAELFRIDVVDDETDRGVPLVFVEIGEERWLSDSGGRIALDPLGWDGTAVAAHVWTHGYDFADAGAIELPIAAGTTLEIEATRRLPAERLYRVTGGGIYRDSVLLGLPVPIAAPTIAGLVVGQDSVFTAMHRGTLRWIWGDTTRPAYPLGNFHASGATSMLPGDGGLDPDLGVDLSYFVDADGFSRAMAPTETVPGEGVTWLGGLVSVPDAAGEPRLHATFAMVRADFTTTRFGMLAYDDANERFVDGVEFDLAAPTHRWPRENAFVVDHGGTAWVYWHAPVRAPARSEALLDIATYETFTPFVDASASQVERDENGRALYRWRAGGIPYPVAGDPALAPADALDGHVVDVATATAFEVHENGSTEWNDWSGRWVRLIIPLWGLGETWIAVSDTPMGPWVYATKLVEHEQYTFYNPRHHRVFDRDFGRRIQFEATYTNTFSGNDDKTPRYDYNQMMYGVDLDRPELALPVPIYTSARGELGGAEVIEAGDAPIVADFFAPRGPAPGTVPVWWSGPSCEPRELRVGGEPGTPPIFWALPTTTPANDTQVELFDDAGEAIAVVWRNPIDVALPVADHLPALRADAGEDQCVAPGAAIDLPPRDDAPEGGSAHWELDGVVITETVGVDFGEGLHVLARVLVRADGFEVRDEAIVRPGPVDWQDASGDGSASDDDDEDDSTADGNEGSGSGGVADEDGGGCGCSMPSSSRAGLFFGLLVLGARQRRRASAASSASR